MLQIFKASGEQAFAMNFEDFVETIGVVDEPVVAQHVKRHLQQLCGQPRFKQRLLLPNGQIMSDDYVLDGPRDIQLILLPFLPSSEGQIDQLVRFAGAGDVAKIEQLLQRPQDPNLEAAQGTPLLLACLNGRVDAVRLLLEACADKDKADCTSATPMALASWRGHAEIVRILLEARADKDKADERGLAPIHVAAGTGRVAVVGFLLEAKADKDRATIALTTPMILAAAMGHVDVVRFLLEARADKNRAGGSGMPPISLASARGHREVVQLLLEAEASKGRATQDRQRPMAAWLAAATCTLPDCCWTPIFRRLYSPNQV